MKIRTFFKTFRIMYRYNKMRDTLRIMKNNLKLLKKNYLTATKLRIDSSKKIFI